MKNFTLLKFIIIVVIIGVLYVMSGIFSTESKISVKASAIATNLRNLKTAVLASYSDNGTIIESDILKYFSDKNLITLAHGSNTPGYYVDLHDSNLYVGYTFKDDETRVLEKIRGKAPALGFDSDDMRVRLKVL